MEYLITNLIFLVSISSVSGRLEPIMLVHGGTDSHFRVSAESRPQGIKLAAMTGYQILQNNGSVVDAVEAAVKVLEDDENFNAGYGSVLNIEGDVEMDASIMVGSNLSSGAVTAIKNVAHPISIARLVMERSPHFLLTAEGAKRFAVNEGVKLIPSKELITPQARQALEDYLAVPTREEKDIKLQGEPCGGVGAIAVDAQGHMAAASSTGGRLAKLPGRVSDAAIVGSGLYVDDNVGAVVVTGHGEAISRYVMANEIIHAMKRGFDASFATRIVVKAVSQKFVKHPAGAITVSKNGHIGISFTTERMAWAYQIRDEIHYGVDDYDYFLEN